MSDQRTDTGPADENATARRGFLQHAATGVMAGGLVAGYGMLAAHAARFLFPAGSRDTAWQFVCTPSELQVGQSLAYVAPSGAKVVIARQGPGQEAGDFIALSSVCPHLGCQVHWEAQNDRFFCPCHNGAFDAAGNPTEGPPATANQPLTRFPLKIENGLLYIEVPLHSVTSQAENLA